MKHRTMQESRTLLEQKYRQIKFSPTGVLKVCPECGRNGHVFKYVTAYDNKRFAIVWEGGSKAAKSKPMVEAGLADPNAKADMDLNVKVGELLSPTFSCGLDG